MHQFVQDHSSVLTVGLIIKGNNFLDSSVRVFLFNHELFSLFDLCDGQYGGKLQAGEGLF